MAACAGIARAYDESATSRSRRDPDSTVNEHDASPFESSDRELAAWLAAIVASADDAIVSKTLDGIVTSWNRAAEAMFGWRAAEVIGRSITLIIPPERLHEEAEVLDRLRRGEAIEHFETERVTRDGRLIPISLSVSPVKDSRGRIIGAAKIARDISERRQAEARIGKTVETLEALYRLADRIGRAKAVGDVCEAGLDAIMAVGPDRAGVLAFDGAGVLRFQGWRHLSDAYRAAVEATRRGRRTSSIRRRSRSTTWRPTRRRPRSAGPSRPRGSRLSRSCRSPTGAGCSASS